MNREIEFRAWINDSYLEKSGYYKNKLAKERIDKLGRMRKVHSMHLNKKKVIITSAWGGNISMSFDDIELMQYTGLKDKNGVKIFEGDIVKRKTNETLEIDDIGDVVYDDDCCSYFIISNETCIYLTSAWDLKVIGNIYENKELLEDE